MIPFHKPYIGPEELQYVKDCFENSKLSGDGLFTRKCQILMEQKYGFSKTLLTPSCTDALELAALLINIEPGDEVIVPSYTFVSTANPFVLRGAKIVFADSEPNHPNICPDSIKSLINKKTKVLVIVHYGGVACNMPEIMHLVEKHNLILIEDAAQAVHAKLNNKYLGRYGNLAAFSFHETKNITCGEGGMLVINDEKFFKRAEIIREKGTNRSAYIRGEVNKYEWADIGSSFLLSDILASILFAQLEKADSITQKRLEIWNRYYDRLGPTRLVTFPNYGNDHNGSVFFVLCKSEKERHLLSEYLKKHAIYTATHYVPLHTSAFGKSWLTMGQSLPNAEHIAHCLLRLPIHCGMVNQDVDYISELILRFLDAY